MSAKSFFIAGSIAAVVANDDTDFRYRAVVEVLPAGTRTDARRNDRLETQFLVESGTIEFMIGGGTAVAFSGDFVRVPAGRVYALANAGDVTARVMVRHVSPSPIRRASAIRVDFAA